MAVFILAIGDGLSAGIGRFVDHMDRMIMIAIAIVLFIQWLLVIVHRKKRTYVSALSLRVLSILFAGFSVLLFQHEVGFYVAGTIVLISSMIGSFLSFKK